MVKMPFVPQTENFNTEEDTKPLNPNELLLSMFNQTPTVEDDTDDANNTESINNEELAQSLLKNLLNQPPVNPNWKPKVETSQNSLKIKFPSLVKAHPKSAAPRLLKAPLLKQPQKLHPQLLLPKPLLKVHSTTSLRTPSGLPSSASYQLQKSEATLSQLNPTLASALSSITSSSNSPLDSALSRRLSGPVRVESDVVPFNVQRSQHHGSHELPSSHVVSYNGSRTEVPNEIRCHLCDYPMKMCYRKSKYKSEIREYPAYRCLRKGCQTFRAIRKVLEPEAEPEPGQIVTLKRDAPNGDEALRSILSQPVASNGPTPAKQHKGEQIGTLIYVPAVLTPNQVLRLQQAAFDILSPESDFYVAPLIAPSAMSATEVKNKLCTPEGRSEIKDYILGSKQMTPQELLSEMNSSPSPEPSSEDMPTLEAA